MTLRLRTFWFLRCEGGKRQSCFIFFPLAFSSWGWSGWGDEPETDEIENLDSDLACVNSQTLEEKRCYKVMEEPNLSKIIDKLIRLINHQNFGWKRLSGPNEHHSPLVLSPSDQRSFVLWQDCSVMKKPRQENKNKAQTVDEGSKFCWYSSWK